MGLSVRQRANTVHEREIITPNERNATPDENFFLAFVIQGEPASKANSRRLVHTRGRPLVIKSVKAMSYAQDFKRQAPRLDPLLDGDLAVTLTIHYASRRPDLDESLILDLMQGCIYHNDRQVKEKHVFWSLDPGNPRTEIVVRPRGCLAAGADTSDKGRKRAKRSTAS
jgi:Holliday junction resolvase RusA-like endonuclease